MKRRLLGALVAGSLLVGLMAVPSLAAQGGIVRYQVGTTTYTIMVRDTYEHDYVVTFNPCDGSIAITGSTPLGSSYFTNETVTGALDSGVISFTSTYDDTSFNGYSWSGSFPVDGGALTATDSLGQTLTGTVTVADTSTTAYKNHGDYVSTMGGGADAAHSCIGMPLFFGAGPAAAAANPDAIKTRLGETLQTVVNKLTAKGNSHAVDAVQKHLDQLAAGNSGLDKAAAAPGHSKSSSGSSGPTLPSQAKGHSTP